MVNETINTNTMNTDTDTNKTINTNTSTNATDSNASLQASSVMASLISWCEVRAEFDALWDACNRSSRATRGGQFNPVAWGHQLEYLLLSRFNQLGLGRYQFGRQGLTAEIQERIAEYCTLPDKTLATTDDIWTVVKDVNELNILGQALAKKYEVNVDIAEAFKILSAGQDNNKDTEKDNNKNIGKNANRQVSNHVTSILVRPIFSKNILKMLVVDLETAKGLL